MQLPPLRLDKSMLLLEQIRTQIQTAGCNALPKSVLAKACNYTLTLWTRLSRFLEYPQLELSNNLAENSMRPVALGRRYEQSRIRQSLTPARREFGRWALDVAKRATLAVFA
jgi:Transposase IS66 family